MKGILKYLFVLLAVLPLTGQQDVLFTQFAYDKLGFNPAYAGAQEHIVFNAIYRNQWIGLDGAPTRFAASVNFPSLEQNLGLGLHIDKSSVAIFDRSSVQGIYSYKIPFQKGAFSLGVNTSLRQFKADWSDPRLRPPDGWDNDPAVDPNLYTKLIFNFGVGAYYRQDNFFAGISIPRLSHADIDFDDKNLDTLQSVESRLVYLMVGGTLELNSNFDLSPQFLLTLPEVGPLHFEASVLGIFSKKYHLGFNYSSGGASLNSIESLDLLAGIQISPQFFFGLSYDITLSELRQVSDGTIELLFTYRVNRKNRANIIINPRYY